MRPSPTKILRSLTSNQTGYTSTSDGYALQPNLCLLLSSLELECSLNMRQIWAM